MLPGIKSAHPVRPTAGAEDGGGGGRLSAATGDCGVNLGGLGGAWLNWAGKFWAKAVKGRPGCWPRARLLSWSSRRRVGRSSHGLGEEQEGAMAYTQPLLTKSSTCKNYLKWD